MIVEPAGLPNVPFADLSPAFSLFRPELSGVGSRIEHMSERVLGVVEREALDRARTRMVALRVFGSTRASMATMLARMGLPSFAASTLTVLPCRFQLPRQLLVGTQRAR